jgi:8-amino-7-oxononanoate synthase
LVAGERGEHQALEAATARLVRAESALAFSSGYAANVGTLAALASPGDTVVSDALNHASLIDGARLSRARVVVVPHLDLAAIRDALAAPRDHGRVWVVTESYFSMDADSPDLGALRAVCNDAGAALVVDEAHALGVLGPEGRGLCVAAGIEPDVLVGTFGKAFGASGAFVAGSNSLTRWLWNRARSFVFSTGMSPMVAVAAREGIAAAAAAPSLRESVIARSRMFREGLSRIGLNVVGHGHVVPWIVGDPTRATRLAEALRAKGVHVQAIRPPSVPPETARLRFTLTARHTTHHVENAIAVIQETLACVPS